MTAINQDALLDQAAKVIKPLFVSAGLVDLDAEDYAYDATAAALPVIAKALLAPLREMHYAAYQDANRNPICPDCHGKAGTHPCGCWAKYDTVPVCGVCWEGWKYIAVEWPCPTVRLLDAIEAEVTA